MRSSRRSPCWAIIAVLLMAGLGFFNLIEGPKNEERVRGFFSKAFPEQSPRTSPAANDEPDFRCDGRTHCSQMTSCAEARYFLRHCPGTEMDGDGDGVPCERQWCG